MHTQKQKRAMLHVLVLLYHARLSLSYNVLVYVLVGQDALDLARQTWLTVNALCKHHISPKTQ